MKKILYLLPFFMLSVGLISAQDNVQVKITNTDDVNRILSYGRFLFPAFQDAELYMRGEGMYKVKMNYNFLTDEMMFIDQKGDTVSIAEPEKIIQIIINKNVFRYHTSKGFMEAIGTDMINDTELMLKRTIQQGDRRKVGPYGTTSSTTGSTEIVKQMGSVSLSATEEVVFTSKNDFYLFKDGKYKAANRAGFLSAYPTHKKEITEYVKQNSVDFKNVNDLQRLFVFCAQK